MIVALTGATGNMGKQALARILEYDAVSTVRVLVLPDDKRVRHIKDRKNPKIEIVRGNVADRAACDALIENAAYVVHMAAVIPPHSDRAPDKAIECNEVGTRTLVEAIEAIPPDRQPRFVHISTVALYGNRNSRHPWGRVGDPLLVSPFDIYSATKLRGEFRVLESTIARRVVIRQTAMLHDNMLSDNMHDGLMFHTCFNAPLEWATAHDSGVLIANILRRDVGRGDLDGVFWGKCFNLGAGVSNCVTGYDTLDDGFRLIGGSTKQFFSPKDNATRNFHGVWFYDSDKLDALFSYRSQTTKDFWTAFGKSHRAFGLAKIVPRGLVRSIGIKRLFKSPNAARYWLAHNDAPRIKAYFGGQSEYDALPAEWKDFPLLIEGRDEWGEPIDYAALKDRSTAKLVDLGRPDDAGWTVEDCKRVASLHGGQLVDGTADAQGRLRWRTSDGVEFSARPYTVLGAGHWLNPTYSENVWDFDRLAKTDRIYAQIWYDSHARDEDVVYWYDADFRARMRPL